MQARSQISNRLLKMINNDDGITLLEIMIVMVILGGLMSILAPKLMGSFQKSKVREAHLQIGEISKDLDMYYTDCNTYPTTAQGLNALLTAPSSDPKCENWGPDAYIKPNLLKDPWGHTFVYSSNGSTYTLKSLGKDGKPGGSGYDADISSDSSK